MTLTVKQRAKINAALCLIHDNGHDASAITAMARHMIGNGADPRSAYTQALNTFADTNPGMLPALSKVVGLVEASDDATVAQYDAALSSYIQSGDDSAVRALAPMIAQDMATLAARNGEAAPEFSAEFQEAAATPQAPQPTEHRTSTFAFDIKPAVETVAGRPVVGRDTDGTPMVRTTSQVSMSGGATGMVAPKAQREWASAPYVGPLSASKAMPAMPTDFAAAKEAARLAVNGGHGTGTFGKPVLPATPQAA